MIDTKVAPYLIYLLLTKIHGHSFCISQVMLSLVDLGPTIFPGYINLNLV
jgi:hypothetical protein